MAHYKACIPVHHLETKEGRELLQHSEVIFARDIMSERQILVYGREMLQAIAGYKQPPSAPIILYVSLDDPTKELEYLLAAVEVLKGRHEYEYDGIAEGHHRMN